MLDQSQDDGPDGVSGQSMTEPSTVAAALGESTQAARATARPDRPRSAYHHIVPEIARTSLSALATNS
jgi:hypothetical protein